MDDEVRKPSIAEVRMRMYGWLVLSFMAILILGAFSLILTLIKVVIGPVFIIVDFVDDLSTGTISFTVRKFKMYRMFDSAMRIGMPKDMEDE